MGMLIDGCWIEDDAQYRNSQDGVFVWPDSPFDGWVTADGASGFAAEPGRYHIFASPACPWAHRALIARRLKRLDAVISVSLADLPTRRSWAFSTGIGRDLQPVDGAFELHRAYVAAKPNYTGRVTVPVLWDKHRWTIVNNESAQIMRMLNSAFDTWAETSIELYPSDLCEEIDRLNARIQADINAGVYGCGFAKSQAVYDEAFDRLFTALDWLEEHLDQRRYLCGDRITEVDWRLFTTLIRFDVVYYSLFRCNRQHLYEYHNLSNYLRELYQTPGIAELTDMAEIKRVYFAIPQTNPGGIVPRGPAELHLDGPHDRGRLRAAS